MIRPALSTDLDALALLEERAQVAPWSASLLATCFGARDHLFVAEAAPGAPLLAWAGMRCVAEDAEVLNLAVDPAQRRQGLARRLMQQLCATARSQGAQRMILEVRESNDAALALYESLGFFVCGVRAGYYPSPEGREDALVMEADLRTGVQRRSA